MILESLSLTNFRNYPSAAFTFSPTTTLVVGPNAAGKTNLLEAIYFLATGKSFRATYDREVIRGGEGFARIKGVKGIKGVKEENGGELEITILANENGENTSSKRLKVNGVKKRLSDFTGNLRAVYFGPEEIELVTGSPSRRRRFMDAVLCQVDREYARALLEYEKVLRQRNRLLLILQEKGINGIKGVNEQLDFWDERLGILGPVLSKKRWEMFADFNKWLQGFGLFLLFQPRSWSNKKESREREIAAGMTLWGPHRENFVFESKKQKAKSKNGQDLSRFGSRGEQRLAVLYLKLAELEFIAERTGERPILLLDDIFSELDENNCRQVLSLLNRQQTIITSTDADALNSNLKTQISKIQIKCQN